MSLFHLVSNLQRGTGFQPVLMGECEKNPPLKNILDSAPRARAGSPCHIEQTSWVTLCGCLLFLFSGCQTEQIPTYPSMPSSQALRILADRSHAIHAISAQAMLTLTRDNGDTVRLDAAIVLQPPDRARLRAYKFSRAVFDMTLTPEGLWLISPQEGDRRQEILAAGANTGKLTREWLRLMTGEFDAPGMTVVERPEELRLQQPRENDSTLICRIDRKTLTPRRYTLTDAQGRERFTLMLDRYAEFAGVVWPRRIEAKSETGNILIELHDVEINGALPPGAFRPPARAEKIAEKSP